MTHPSTYLIKTYIAVDNTLHPSYVQVTIKQSKTDPIRVGVNVIIGRTRGELCPVAALLAYVVLRSLANSPLFRFQRGNPLTRTKFVGKLQEVLSKLGIDCSKYSGHSFRIEAATTAVARGVQDSLIKTMGR